MRSSIIHVAGCLAAALAASAVAAHATVLVPGTLAELVRDAQVIVRGRVADVRFQFTDGRRRVETVVVLEAESYLKGDYGSQVVFKVPGGEIGRYQSVMVGAPVFRQGDEVVLFLSSQEPELPHLVGFNQGVLRLVRDAATGRALVQSPPPDATGTKAQTIRRGEPARHAMVFEEFAARVQSLVTPRKGAALQKPSGERPVIESHRAVARPDKKKEPVKLP
jgi:hypothetical protein